MHCALAGIPGAIAYRTDALTYLLGRLAREGPLPRARKPAPGGADVPGAHPGGGDGRIAGGRAPGVPLGPRQARADALPGGAAPDAP